MSVEQKVKQIIVEQLGGDEAQVDPTASFVDDLGADSLDDVERIGAQVIDETRGGIDLRLIPAKLLDNDLLDLLLYGHETSTVFRLWAKSVTRGICHAGHSNSLILPGPGSESQAQASILFYLQGEKTYCSS